MIVLSCRVIVKRGIYTHIYSMQPSPPRNRIHYFLIVLLQPRTIVLYCGRRKKMEVGKGITLASGEGWKNGERNFGQVEFQTLITARESLQIYSINSGGGKSDSTRVTVFLRFTSPPPAYSIRFNEYRFPRTTSGSSASRRKFLADAREALCSRVGLAGARLS